MKKQILSLLLCAAMLCGFVPRGIVAYASASTEICEHHGSHTEDCGYREGVEGSPCTHEHTEDCYLLETNCVHSHDETCYPDEASDSDETVSDNSPAPSNADEAEPTECTHACSEESGCVTKKLNCTHAHDENCGYAEAVEGTPCGYDCPICSGSEPDSSTPCEEHSFGAWTISGENSFARECALCGESEASEEPDFMSGLTELETADGIAAELNRLHEEKIIDDACYETLVSLFLDSSAVLSADSAVSGVRSTPVTLVDLKTAFNGTEGTSTAHFSYADGGIEAWNEGNTRNIKLNADVEGDKGIAVSGGKTVVLDLNGHTVSGTGSYVLGIAGGSTLTVKDDAGTGSIIGDTLAIND